MPKKVNETLGLFKPFNEKSLKCDLCSFTAYSDRYLWLHKEKSHINDPTQEEMIGTKRDIMLVKTSSISEPPRKKTTVDEKGQYEEIDILERSKQNDAKILEKRKREEEEEERLNSINDLKNKEKQELEQKRSNSKNVPDNNKNKRKELNKEEVAKPKAVDCLNPNSL